MDKEKKKIEEMSSEELKKELEFTRECLLDEEELHGFSMAGTSVHIGAQEATRMQDEHEEKCTEYRDRIEKIEALLKQKNE